MLARFLTRTDAALLAWTLLTKLAVLALGYGALWAVTGSAPGLLEPWDRWDAPHYTDIAVFGYMANDPGVLHSPGYEQAYPGDLDLYIVFFPLFPWLVGAVNAVIGVPVLAAFVVASVASLFVAPILYRLVTVDLGHRIGRSAVLLLVFPTAYFLHIGYTESLFLALAFGSMWLARTDRWWLAGLLALLAALTRVNGLILVPTLAVEAWLQWRRDRRLRLEWLAIGGAAIGFGIYLWVNLLVYGSPVAFAEIQQAHWSKDLSPPWDGVASVLTWFGRRGAEPIDVVMYGGMELLFIVIGLVATVATALWLRPTWAAWMAGNWLLSVSTGYVLSVPRYSLVLFGIMVWGAILAQRWRTAGWVLAAASAASLAFFAMRFGAGQWAF